MLYRSAKAALVGSMVIFAFLATIGRTNAQTIDFSSCAAFCSIDPFTTFSESGFAFTEMGGSGSIAGFGPDPELGISTGTIRLTRNGGGLFNLLNFDLVFRNSLDALGTFVVTSSNGGTQPVSALGTYNLSGPAWQTLSWVDFTVVTGEFFSDNNTIDNIVLAAINPPLFSKTFAPDSITIGGVSTLTYAINNTGNTLAATSLAFTETLPAGVVIADPAGAATSCGGMGNATPGANSFSFSGSVAAGASCTISFDVTSTALGATVSTSGPLTSSLGNSGTAVSTLMGNPARPIPTLPALTLIMTILSLMLIGARNLVRARTDSSTDTRRNR